jgi:FKBP-type peptidyl-prolyl cis-trans isomerase 2
VTAKEGDTVKVLYTGNLDDGSVFDSSELHGNVPLEFTIGNGRLLPDFEQAVIGMKINETINIHIPAEEAYGPHDPDLFATLDWSQFEGYEPSVGEVLHIQSAYVKLNGTVLSISEEGVTVDTNHYLAGKDINFEITLVEILSD